MFVDRHRQWCESRNASRARDSKRSPCPFPSFMFSKTSSPPPTCSLPLLPGLLSSAALFNLASFFDKALQSLFKIIWLSLPNFLRDLRKPYSPCFRYVSACHRFFSGSAASTTILLHCHSWLLIRLQFRSGKHRPRHRFIERRADPDIEMKTSDETDHLVTDIKEALRSVPPLPTECCIYKVPGHLRGAQEAAYRPKIVSIGPLHHGDANLKSMEVHKRRYLNVLLRRNPDIGLDECVKILRGLEDEVRKNYHEDHYPCRFSSDEFVAMMLLDSSFIIELFLSLYDTRTADPYDQIIHSKTYSHIVYNDIVLLENQLPFFLLDQLFNFINGPDKKCTTLSFPQLSEYHLPYYGEGCRTVQLRNPTNSQAKHFVSFVLDNHLPSDPRRHHSIRITEVIDLPSATKLHEAGVKFGKRNGAKLLDIRFCNGVLEMPTLCVDDNTEHRFKNMIAMEQCHPGNTSHITDYMILMNSLINSPNDVALLRSLGIVKSPLGSDDVLAHLLNSIVKGVNRDLQVSYYYALIQDVNIFYNRRFNLWVAKLRRDYFTHPWAVISFSEAIILLICTLLQTTVSILQMK